MGSKVRRGGRTTPRKSSTHLRASNIRLGRELIDGRDCVVMEFEQPNVTFRQALDVKDAKQFIRDLVAVVEREAVRPSEGPAVEDRGGLSIARSGDLEGILAGLRSAGDQGSEAGR